jgi:hypothetical protein
LLLAKAEKQQQNVVRATMYFCFVKFKKHKAVQNDTNNNSFFNFATQTIYRLFEKKKKKREKQKKFFLLFSLFFFSFLEL